LTRLYFWYSAQLLGSTNRIFGNCGKIVYRRGKPVGYAQYSSCELLPRSADYKSGSPGDDAVLISCLFIPLKDFRRLGLASRLIRAIVEDLRKNGIKAIETFARKGKADNPSGPAEFYLKNGFRIQRDDPEFPLMRLDL